MKEDIPQFIKQVNLYMPDDDEYIINNYPAKSLKQIANDLNRTHKSLISRFRRLGLRNKEDRKTRSVRHQEQAIAMLEYIKLNAPARTEDIGNHFGISRKVAGNRLKTIQMNGINGIFIQSVRHGSYGAAWILGKQKKIKTMESRTPTRRDKSLNLTALPPILQKWFAYVPGFEPAQGRVIEEKMPDIPLSRSKYTIGCGTQFMIGELANL